MNLITKLHLGENTNAQCIYSSQLYGTFFSIYAIIEAVETKDKKAYNLKGISLKVINYKGVLNMGIVDAELIDTNWDANGTVKRSLRIAIQATYKGSHELFPVKILPATNRKIRKESVILVERFLSPIDENLGAEKNGVFDSELYYREGVYDENTARKTRHLPRLWNDRPLAPKKGSNQVYQDGSQTAMGAGGKICPYRLLIII